MALSNYIPICDSIVLLMNPLVEVVIHHIEKNRIVYVNGKLSGRKVSDPSLLDQEQSDHIDRIIYPKINFDGKLVKSISITLEEKWLLCINCDVSLFGRMQEVSQAILLSTTSDQPKSLFNSDWQEKLHASIHSYLQGHHLSFSHLTQRDKKALIQHLFNLGAFREKNAADYVAKALQLGRATVFKYLKEWKNQ